MSAQDELKDVHPMTILRLFEADVARRNYAQAEECLQWLLANCPIHFTKPNKVIPQNFTEAEVIHVATRISSGVCQMFSDPKFGITDDGFPKFAVHQATLTTLMSVSGFGSADHVIQSFVEPVEGGKNEIVSRETFNKMLLLHSIASSVSIPLDHYLESHPKHVIWMVLLAVGQLFCVTEKENKARNHLIDSMMYRMDITAFDPTMLGWLAIAWMHCSYATMPDRNYFKRILNRMVVSWMARIGIEQNQSEKPRNNKGKPILIVVNEYFSSKHAMYRCYAPTIQALRKHFHIVGYTFQKHWDEESIKLFDEHKVLPASSRADEFLREVILEFKKIRPNAIYYPSVGMQLYVILMANLRLAPVQFMSMGHPASSFSDVMDYCLVENQFLADTKKYSENIFIMEDNAGAFKKHSEQPDRSELFSWRHAPLDGEPIRIIITGSAMKVNGEFIHALAKIEKGSKREVEFHFIPNLNSLCRALFNKQLSDSLKKFVIHPSMDYKSYLKLVSKCQLHLSPFPFGSTNSLIDSILVGIPLVVMHTLDTEQTIDSTIINKLGIAEMAPAKTVEEYINKACELIDDDVKRACITKILEEKDIDAIYFSSQPDPLLRSAEGIHELVVKTVA